MHRDEDWARGGSVRALDCWGFGLTHVGEARLGSRSRPDYGLHMFLLLLLLALLVQQVLDEERLLHQEQVPTLQLGLGLGVEKEARLRR